jgi:hypothetical protein
MSNYFKQNSRFGALNDEINVEKREKRNDRDKRDSRDKRDNRDNRQSSLSYRERQIAISALREEEFAKNEKKRLEEEKAKNLSIESFPELVKSSKLETTSNMPSFLEKIKTEVDKKPELKSKEQTLTETLQPGWTLFTFDKKINKIKMVEKRIIRNGSESLLNEIDIAHNVLDALANLHENRRQEYINNWGEDEYEKMFIFPNYDYDYFDKLDEKYEEEQRKLNSVYENCENDDDDYEEY